MCRELIVIGSFRLLFERREQARIAMTKMILASRAEVGCIEYSYAFDLEDKNLVRVCERWESREHFDRHRLMPHLREWRASWSALQISDPHLFTYESEREDL